MTVFRRLSVKWLLVIVLVAFTAIILLVQGIPLSSYLRTVERDRIVTGLQRDAFTLAGAAEEALHSGTDTASPDSDAVSSIIGEYGAATGARVVVIDDLGRVAASSDGTDVQQDYANRPEVQVALTGQTSSGVRASQTAGEPLLYVAVPVRSGSEILGAVRITYPAAEVDARVDERVRLLAVVGLITLVAAAGIAILLAGVVTGPLRRLRETSEAIADGDLAARVDTDTIGELRTVADSFNRMAGRVESLVTMQRGFAGDASHQLRTPLTALRLRLDAAQTLGESEPAALMRSMDAMRDDVDRMQRMVDGLLLLARADRDDQSLIVVDPVAIVNARVDEWRALIAERDLSVVVTTPENSVPSVLAVADGLDQIVDNYLDNAVEIAPPGSTIRVGVMLTDGGVSIEVEDSGPGLSDEGKARAFDRFWRGGRGAGSGSGLGLSIVQALAEASHASVRLEDAARSSTGVRAVVELQAAAEPATLE